MYCPILENENSLAERKVCLLGFLPLSNHFPAIRNYYSSFENGKGFRDAPKKSLHCTSMGITSSGADNRCYCKVVIEVISKSLLYNNINCFSLEKNICSK